MNPTDKPIANPVVALREEFDNWAVLFNPDTADAVGISPVGVAIWKLLDGRRTLPQIVAALQEEFTEVPGTAADEVAQFVDELIKRGFAEALRRDE